MISDALLIKVMIASPGGLDDERNLIQKVVAEVGDALPVDAGLAFRVLRWENEVGDFGRPQEQLNPLARACQVFVGLLADRWGSQTGTHSSGFFEEYEVVRERRLRSRDAFPRIWLFTKSTINPHQADPEQLKAVMEFVKGVKDRREALVNSFADLNGLEAKVRHALQRLVIELQTATPIDPVTLTGSGGEQIKSPAQSNAIDGDIHVQTEGPPTDTEPSVPIEEGSAAVPGDWTEVLATGPLQEAGQLARVYDAEKREASDPVAAAKLYEQAADGLSEQGYAPLGEVYAGRAINLCRQAGDERSAAALSERVIRGQLRRGSDLAGQSARRLLNSLEPQQKWRATVLLALAEWPERFEWSIGALRNAIEHLDAEGASVDDAVRLAHLASLVELLVIDRQYEQALAAAAPARELPLARGDRLQIELDAVEATEAMGETARAEELWRALLKGAMGPADAASDQAAMIWQRRGVSLAIRGDVDGAQEAFRRGANEWSRQAGHEDQVREAYFASQLAGGLNGRLSAEGEAMRPFAADLRGSDSTPAGRAESLEARGMGHRIRGKAFDALRCYWLAYAEHHRVGNLRGMMWTLELLGELMSDAGYPASAVSAYVRTGRESEAAKAAPSAPEDALLDELKLGIARWERAAGFAVIAAVGRQLSNKAVAKIAGPVISDAQVEMTSLVSPQPAMRAQEALAAIAFGLPESQRESAIDRLREIAVGRFVGTARPALEALMLLTNAGVSDETKTVAAAFLADSGLSGVSPIWIGERLKHNAEVQSEVVSAARGKSIPALEAAAVAGLPSEDSHLAELCEQHVRAVIDKPVVEEVEQNGMITRSIGIGAAFELPALLARYVPPALTEQFAAHMATIATAPDVPLLTRYSAANAIFNVADRLGDSTGDCLKAPMRTLVLGEIALSDWDQDETSPFSRIQIGTGSAGLLRAAALSAWSKLVSDSDEDIASAIEFAMVDPDSAVAAAAYEALERLPQIALPRVAAAGLTHIDSRVRAASVSCWLTRTGEAPTKPILERLINDDTLQVRLALLWGSEELVENDRTWILDRLAADHDAYLRALVALKRQQT